MNWICFPITRMIAKDRVNTKVFLRMLSLKVILACTLISAPPMIGWGQMPESKKDAIQSVNEQELKTEKLTLQERNVLTITANLAWEAMHVVEKHHVDPPLMNQMILDGIGQLAPHQKSELRSKIKGVRTRNDFQAVLQHVLTESKGMRTSLANINSVEWANAFLRRVPGSPQVVSNYQAKIDKQLSENRYVGIGISIRQVEHFVQVDVAFRGGPAQKAGFLGGDEIRVVDGKPMRDKSIGEVVTALRGPQDSEVTVEVGLPGKPSRTYTMTRGVVPIASVQGVAEKGETDWDYRLPGPDRIAYIEISSITGSTAAELRSALRQISRSPFDAILLDFRNSFQAELHHMKMVADVLIAADQLGTWIDSSGKSHPIKIRNVSDLPDLPISVLVSPAQNNEVRLLVEALRRHAKAKVVGQLSPAIPRIRGSVSLPSGTGKVMNLFTGTASFESDSLGRNQELTANRTTPSRFRSGDKIIDALIKRAAAAAMKG